MLQATPSLALLLCVVLGCGCRTDIEREPDQETEPEEEEGAECVAELTPRVEDCVRAAPNAVPLAPLFGSYLVADEGFLYYASEGRAFRLSMVAGEPEPLTPPDSVRGAITYVADGFLYWMQDAVVQRVPATGGEPELLVEMVQNARWAVADDAILWSGPNSEPTPLYLTSYVTGQTTELLVIDPAQTLNDIVVEGDRALVELGNSLRGTYRVDIDEPPTRELVLTGFPIALSFDEDALYAHIVPEPDVVNQEMMPHGRIVRAPLSGGEPVEITGTSSLKKSGAAWVISSRALVVSGCNIYFIERCTTDPPGTEARLVTMSKLPSAL